MKKILKIALVLSLITSISVSLCALVNFFTKDKILQNQEGENKKAYEYVSSGFTLGERKEGRNNVKEYLPLLKDNKIDGYALTLLGKGYGGEFTLIASFDTSGRLIKAKMSKDDETSGLGKKAENDDYMDIFSGMGGEKPFPRSKNDLDGKDREYVSGATITLKGVLECFREGSEFVKGLENE